MKRQALFAVFLALGAILLAGCGHPASVRECEEIVETIARLELSTTGADKDAVAEDVQATKNAMRSDMMKRCVGRRITDSAMACVRHAKRAQEIELECFR